MAPNYELACDIVRREIAPSQRCGNVDLICFYLNMVEGMQDSESKTFREIVKSKYFQIWLRAVNDDTYSLIKNYTCEIVILPKK